jgi:hypothetical protein
MRQIWHHTVHLFWQNPILWLPLIFADLLAFCLGLVQSSLSHEIAARFFEDHSLPGNTPEYSRQATTLIQNQVLAASFGLVTQLLSICLYTLAFLITAQLVRLILQDLSPNLWSAVRSASLHLGAIFSFSLKLFGWAIVSALLLATPVYFFIFQNHQRRLMETPLFTHGLALLVAICVAYFITPAAIELLRSPTSQPVPPKVAWQGCGFSIPIVMVSQAIAFCAEIAERSFLSNSIRAQPLDVQAIHAIASLLSAFPYIFLFIALSLITISAVEDDVELQAAEPHNEPHNEPA